MVAPEIELLIVLAEARADVQFHLIKPLLQTVKDLARCRSSMNALMISMFTAMARSLRSTPESNCHALLREDAWRIAAAATALA